MKRFIISYGGARRFVAKAGSINDALVQFRSSVLYRGAATYTEEGSVPRGIWI